MNVLHLNSFTSVEKITFPHIMIHNQMLKDGVNSQIISFSGNYKGLNISYIKNTLRSKFNISRIMRKVFFGKKNSYYYFPEWNLDCISLKTVERELFFKPDLIIVYWSKFFFNAKLIHQLSEKYQSRVMYYLLDMAHLTGGCNYSNGCSNYSFGCGNCPALLMPHKNDISRRTFDLKYKYLKLINPGLIVPSFELATQVDKSLIWRERKQKKILLSVDEDVFSPLNRIESLKLEYNLKMSDKVILFAASNINDPRKGFDLYHKALIILADHYYEKIKNCTFLFLGNQKPVIDSRLKYLHINYKTNTKDLAAVFGMADVFVNVSLEDAGPLILNQAVMSGLPVVSFGTGVALDLIDDSYNGFIVKNKNSESLASSLIRILELPNEKLITMSTNSRQIGIEKITPSAQLAEILLFFKELGSL